MDETTITADKMEPIQEVFPVRLKRMFMNAGIVLTLLGLPPGLNLLCSVPLSLLSGALDTPVYVMVSLVLVVATLIAGGVTFYHANRSLNGKPSNPMRLPSMLFLMDIFGVLLIAGIFVNAADLLPGVSIPPFLFLAAALPPLWVISCFIEQKENAMFKLTWRRGMVALAGGASASLLIAILLESLLPVIILVLGSGLFGTVSEDLDSFFRVMDRTHWATALTSPGFFYVFLQFTLIAPLVEEFAKPLVLLPILRRIDRQETFLLGAIAGAGFAILENNIYATIGIGIWLEFLFIRALGIAIQPLGSGLVALGWRDILRGKPGAWGLWTRRFGSAVVVHAAWNAGSLLVVVLGEALIAGNVPRETTPLGIVALGGLFIFLTLLGLSALWLGHALGQGKIFPFSWGTSGVEPASSNRILAIWGLACLMFIIPTGIILTRLWLR